MTPKAIMIFAAGRGTRMGRLTERRPKPLIEVAGQPLIDHALALADGLPLRKVVNTHHLADQVAAHLANNDVAISNEAPDLLETGGGLRQALPLLGDGPVLTLNSDAVWRGPNPLEALLEAWDPDRMDGLLLLVPPQRATGHTGKGDFEIAPDGRLARSPGHVYTGAQIIRTERLGEIAETAFSLNLLWDRLLTENRLYGLPYQGEWCDVGTPDGIRLAEQMLERDNV